MTVQAAAPRVATPASRYVANETMVGIIVNLIMAGLVTTLTNRADAFNGANLSYVASDMAKATIFPILAFGFGLTMATRKRLGTGAVATFASPPPAWSPRNLLLRLIILAAIALVVLGAPAALALYGLCEAKALTPIRLMLFKLAYGAVIGVLVTPVVLILALYDRPTAPRGASRR
jgi:hypothetical protein